MGRPVIEEMRIHSNTLWGTAPKEFACCGAENLGRGITLQSCIALIENSAPIAGLLIIPYVDGGLIVLANYDGFSIEGSKSADWWELHY